jgi:hypothetical protein
VPVPVRGFAGQTLEEIADRLLCGIEEGPERDRIAEVVAANVQVRD